MGALQAKWRIDNIHFKWSGIESRRFNPRLDHPVFAASDYSLLAVVGGSGQALVGGRRTHLRQGRSILLLPGTSVLFDEQASQSMHAFVVTFSAIQTDDARPDGDLLGFACGTPVAIQPFASLVGLLNEIYAARETADALEAFKRNIRLQEIVHLHLSAIEAEQPSSTLESVERTISYLQSRFDEEITLTQLAAMAGISQRQYSHLFKQITGDSPMDYLSRQRIDRAKRLLQTASGDLLSVAQRVGFKDEFYFSRRFKQQVGVSPSAYVRTTTPRVIGLIYTSHLLALGIVPVGAPDYHLDHNDYVRRYLGEMTRFSWAPCEIEKMKRLNPDYVLGYEHMTPYEYEQLSGFAEIIRVNWQSQDVYEQMSQVAAVLGKQKQEKKWMEEHFAKLHKVRNQMRSHFGDNDTCAAIVVNGNGFSVAGDRNMGHVLFRSLGLKPHPAVQEHIQDYTGTNVFTELLPFESLSRYDADRIFVMANAKDPDATAAFARLRQTEIWSNLKAVKQAAVHVVPYDRWWMYTPLAIDGQLDALPTLLQRNDAVS